MRLILFSLLVIPLFLFVFWTTNADEIRNLTSEIDNLSTNAILGNSNKEEIRNYNGYSIFEDDSYIIIRFNSSTKLNLLDRSDSLVDAEEVLEATNALASINAGYFQEDFSHAGLLKINGIVINSIVPGDSQLSHVLDTDTLNLYPSTNISEITQNVRNGFQTGPLFIINGEVSEVEINTSLNGSSSHRRSFIGVNQANEVFIGVSKSNITLDKLASDLIANSFLDSEIKWTLNLDGGSSTSIAASDKVTSYRANKQLPYFLVIFSSDQQLD